MAKIDPARVADWLSVQTLIHDWATELDIENGLSITDLLCDDVTYTVRGGARTSAASVLGFYQTRFAELGATEAGVPIHRHVVYNLRVDFESADLAKARFGMVYFSTAGQASGTKHADPALVADVEIDARLCADGHWRIARFDSAPVFMRVS